MTIFLNYLPFWNSSLQNDEISSQLFIDSPDVIKCFIENESEIIQENEELLLNDDLKFNYDWNFIKQFDDLYLINLISSQHCVICFDKIELESNSEIIEENKTHSGWKKCGPMHWNRSY